MKVTNTDAMAFATLAKAAATMGARLGEASIASSSSSSSRGVGLALLVGSGTSSLYIVRRPFAHPVTFCDARPAADAVRPPQASALKSYQGRLE